MPVAGGGSDHNSTTEELYGASSTEVNCGIISDGWCDVVRCGSQLSARAWAT